MLEYCPVSNLKASQNLMCQRHQCQCNLVGNTSDVILLSDHLLFFGKSQSQVINHYEYYCSLRIRPINLPSCVLRYSVKYFMHSFTIRRHRNVQRHQALMVGNTFPVMCLYLTIFSSGNVVINITVTCTWPIIIYLSNA